jgi:hypothetical protein
VEEIYILEAKELRSLRAIVGYRTHCKGKEFTGIKYFIHPM